MTSEAGDRSQDEESNRSSVKRVMSALYPEVVISATEDGFEGSATYHPQKEHTGAPGWVQGGLAATVLDFVSARVARRALDSPVATGTLDLRYRQPVLIDGGPYEVIGTAEGARSRTVRVSSAIVNSSGHHLVEATGLFVAVTRETAPTIDSDS